MKQISDRFDISEIRPLDGILKDIIFYDVNLEPDDFQEVKAFDNVIMLGCSVPAELLARVVEMGALVFPQLPGGLPFEPYRSALYTLGELMEGYDRANPRRSFLQDTKDSKVFAYFHGLRQPDMEDWSPEGRWRYAPEAPMPLVNTLAHRLHDHSIDKALSEVLSTKNKVAAIMGGHRIVRDEPIYYQVAQLARELTLRGYYIAGGGGPGAMEAANFGAWFGGYTEDEMERAWKKMKAYSDFRRYEPYIDAAYEVLDQYPQGAQSLAIPTWFYGHEPTNQFATQIAKYFSNSIREDGLLAVATHGVIYTPGSAGTVQEIFMDASQNHYGTFRWVSPMVFLGKDFWEKQMPAFALLKKLAGDRRYAEALLLSDDVDEIVEFLEAHPPVEFVR